VQGLQISIGSCRRRSFSRAGAGDVLHPLHRTTCQLRELSRGRILGNRDFPSAAVLIDLRFIAAQKSIASEAKQNYVSDGVLSTYFRPTCVYTERRRAR
jgi:hypothetical protein